MAYLKSPQWQARRQRIIARDKCCADCGTKKKLQVNHLKYVPWNSSIEQFIKQSDSEFNLLCDRCHRKYTNQQRKKRKS